jgi:hypothetical protein
MNYITTPIEECAFEPESAEICCVDCGKPTGVMGTCQDIGFCADCRASYESEESIGKAGFSKMLISMIEGKSYNAKYARKRVLHVSVDGKPACNTRGGPHPLTTNRNESNCKRCLKATKQ